MAVQTRLATKGIGFKTAIAVNLVNPARKSVQKIHSTFLIGEKDIHWEFCNLEIPRIGFPSSLPLSVDRLLFCGFYILSDLHLASTSIYYFIHSTTYSRIERF